MSVENHLNISIDEYDERIRGFVPHYDRLISTTAGTLDLLGERAPTVVDLGVGTGALSAACLRVRPFGRVVGIDADPSMLKAARDRLSGMGSVELRAGDFLTEPLPACDAIVACISLHHVPTPAAKRALYQGCFDALRPGGLLVSGDNFSARVGRVAERDRADWIEHMERSYSSDEARAHLDAWATEDVYFPLADEVAWLEEVGFVTEVLWRDGGFAVVAAFRPPVSGL